jgi:GT2 family glycosyltransferase
MMYFTGLTAPNMYNPKIAIIVLHMNGKDVLGECLHSIERLDYPNYVVIVVDNNSSDGSQAFVADAFPDVHLIQNKNNVGVPEGQNIGIRAAVQSEADYVFTINNDTVLDRNVLWELLSALEEDKTIGAAGPVLYSMKDTNTIENAGGNIDWNKGSVVLSNVGETAGLLTKIADVDYISFFFADPNVLESVGLFNKKYFAYWEDTDLCYRLKKAGYRVVRVSTARVWHKHSHTARRVSGFYEYHYTRNQFWFWKTHATKTRWISFLLSFFFFTFWQRSAVILLRKRDYKAFASQCKGVFDGLILNVG